MSIATKGVGLLGSHVSWEDVETALHTTTGRHTRFGERKTISDIGEGNGLLSKIGLVSCDFLEPQPPFPNKFVVKILSMLPQAEIDKSVVDNEKLHGLFQQAHNREVSFYEILWKYRSDKLLIPKIYASRRFNEENLTKGFIVMEYVEDCIVKPAVENISLCEFDQAIDAIAELVSITPYLTEAEKHSFPKDQVATTVTEFYTKEMITSQLNEIGNFLGDAHTTILNELSAELEFIMSSNMLNKIVSVHEVLGIEPVLSHGDLWSPNLLWVKKVESTKLRAIIDFQFANLGNAANDFATVACAMLDPETRREHYRRLMEVYYEKIVAKFESTPFTHKQLELANDYVFPLCAYNAMSSTVSIIPSIDMEKFDTSRNQCVEKCVALIEDIISASKKLRTLEL